MSRHWSSTYGWAAVVAGVSIALAAVAMVSGLWQSAPAPFVWPDVVLVYWLCLLPLLVSLRIATKSGLKDGALPTIAAVLILAVLILLLVPQFYIHARVANDAQRARQLVEESRFGEAEQLLARVLLLKPKANWQGVELRQAAQRLQAIVEPIEARVAGPLIASASEEERLSRARDLAMLGRNREALEIIQQSTSLAASTDACNLRGAIYESLGKWRVARDAYGHGLATQADRASRARALEGLAHCERKLGRLRQAEAAYQELLALSPTAETHFLLAQFYDDTQQASLAAMHAGQAMRLAPEQFARRSQQLLNHGATSQFGCLGAFWRASELSVPPIYRR